MFTGIVETVGEVLSVATKGDLSRIDIATGTVAAGVRIGDSIAVNGACLTVCEIEDARLAFDAVRETLEKTSLSELATGSNVNLERAMRADARFDGHIVQGHVDGVGRVDRLEREGDDVKLFIGCDPDFADLLVEKGSVAIDGVSLTVCGVRADGFDVALIPHTLAVTTLGKLEPGDVVNLEGDILGKYVRRYLGRILPTNANPAP